MFMTKETYSTRGRVNAQASHEGLAEPFAHGFIRGVGNWQAKTYWEAYDAELERLKGSALAQPEKERGEAPGGLPIDPGLMPKTGTDFWPTGAAEHARQLKKALSKERGSKRAKRLFRSLHRLYNRHGWPEVEEDVHGAARYL